MSKLNDNIKNKNNKSKIKTKFTSKNVKFEVGDIIYGLYIDNGSDYSIRQLSLEQFKIKSIEITDNKIYYQTTTECTMEVTLTRDGTENFYKSKETALKAYNIKALTHFDEKLVD
jgi:hypothetical protein